MYNVLLLYVHISTAVLVRVKNSNYRRRPHGSFNPLHCKTITISFASSSKVQPTYTFTPAGITSHTRYHLYHFSAEALSPTQPFFHSGCSYAYTYQVSKTSIKNQMVRTYTHAEYVKWSSRLQTRKSGGEGCIRELKEKLEYYWEQQSNPPCPLVSTKDTRHALW